MLREGLLPTPDDPVAAVSASGDAWTELLRLALRVGIAPEAFWRLSWREWQALTAMPVRAPLNRADFDALMARFPDDKT